MRDEEIILEDLFEEKNETYKQKEMAVVMGHLSANTCCGTAMAREYGSWEGIIKKKEIIHNAAAISSFGKIKFLNP